MYLYFKSIYASKRRKSKRWASLSLYKIIYIMSRLSNNSRRYINPFLMHDQTKRILHFHTYFYHTLI